MLAVTLRVVIHTKNITILIPYQHSGVRSLIEFLQSVGERAAVSCLKSVTKCLSVKESMSFINIKNSTQLKLLVQKVNYRTAIVHQESLETEL